ncbi:type II secretion system F family protein [Lentzea flaviverrucosa]|uniref:Tight adherence protein C n=1 Tax=Lentzea flaviverrucosa TaxID=200379 RepID=A0A1H9MUD4_9PSEU|nr:type II secretion system F family protein [Lentzea flaviverrucosa]RDI30779.1 tight adherence protein C [Lentzea flaviverrucosa]SER27278.1 tight adherence protein C [Lentzea flaviverrucosa]
MALYLGVGCLLLAVFLGAFALVVKPRVTAAGSLALIETSYSAAVTAKPDAVVSPGWLRSIALRLSPAGVASGLQRRLDLAGNPATWTPDRVLAAKGLGLLLGLGLGGLLGARSVGWLVAGLVLGAVFGFFLPDLLLLNAGQKRQELIRRALPDALDMLTVCVEAGLGFDAAMAQVARNTSGPLAQECARVLQEMQIGKSRNESLRALTVRTTVAELRAFVSALAQAGELGVPIASVLREQAREMRLRRRQRAEEQAQKVPVKILFPLITCLFPAMFVIIIGPGAISIARVLMNL